jgi:hypothetical protein
MNTPNVPKVRIRPARASGSTADAERPLEPQAPQRATLTLKASAVPRTVARTSAPKAETVAKVSLPESARWSAPNGR